MILEVAFVILAAICMVTAVMISVIFVPDKVGISELYKTLISNAVANKTIIFLCAR